MDISKIKIGENTYNIKDTNTTYTFANGTNGFTVTPSDGTAQTVTVTPSISKNVTGSAAWSAANSIVVTNASSGNVVKQSGVSITTSSSSFPSTSDTSVPTSKAIASYISSQIGTALTSALTYKGSVGTGGTVTALPSSDNKTGDVYVVKTAGTYDGAAMEVGDYLIYNGTAWDKINGENQVDNKSASLAAPNSTATIATIDGTDITIKTPSTWQVTDNNTTYKFTIGTTTNGDDVNGVDLGTLNSETAAANGTTLSLVTTGEKATWNAKTSNTGTITSVKFNGGTAVTSGAVVLNETDPVFSASAAAGITSTDISNWNAKTSNTGTVTSVSAGVGLAGGPVTSTGSLKAKLKSETKHASDLSAGMTSSGGKLYAVGLDKSGYLAVNIPWTDTVTEYSYDSSTETLELFNLSAHSA